MTIVCKNVTAEQVKQFMELGFALDSPKTEYEEIRMTKQGATLVLYTSGKLVIQVKDEQEEKIEYYLKHNGFVIEASKEKQNTEPVKIYHNVIGSDETLKGDTFGGLIVVGAYFSKEEEHILTEFGVKDSKLLSDKQIDMLGQMLLGRFPDRFIIEELEPSEYNMLIAEKKSATVLLNDLHEKTGKKLKQLFGEDIIHLVDEYPGCSVGDERITKAEQASLAVAAASIVARHKGLAQFERLSDQVGFNLPKGSTHVGAALDVLIKKDVNLELFAKTSFKNVKKIL